jgi:hypothetical protein
MVRSEYPLLGFKTKGMKMIVNSVEAGMKLRLTHPFRHFLQAQSIVPNKTLPFAYDKCPRRYEDSLNGFGLSTIL